MRADRLITILMLLQSRGQMTARALAEMLSVSERTIYRDVDALCASGVPVYATYGPGGGFALVDSYRTNLTGMTEDELRALFMLSVPAPLERLGISQELRSALQKLSAALPSERRANEQLVQQRFLIDWSAFQMDEPVPHLNTLQQGVWNDRRVQITYRLLVGVTVENAPVDPYALVAKAGAWFLVGAHDGHPEVYRVANLIDVHLTGERFARPAGFDLSRFWNAWCARYEQEREIYPVRVRIAPQVHPYLSLFFGSAARELLAQAGPPDPLGWRTLTVRFESLEAARGRLLALGRAVEVLDPPALRYSLVDFAQQIVDFYSELPAVSSGEASRGRQ